MFKRALFIFISVIVILLCAYVFLSEKTSEKASERVVVSFASWGSESEISILTPLIKEFEKANPNISVNFMHIPQNYFQKIHLLFASKTAPDVIFINNQYLPVYADAGVLEDLSMYCAELECEKFYPQAIDSLTYNEKIYAIPRDISNMVVYYNKDLFKKYHIPFPKNTWTFNDFLETSKKLSHPPKVFGVSFEENPLFYLPFLTSQGGWTKTDIEEYFAKEVLNSDSNRSGLLFYADLRKKHYAPQKEESASATMAQMFLQERVGMHISGRWLVPKYREDAKFDWDIVQFPKGSKGSIVPLDSSGWSIAKDSKYKNESIKLIKYLSSQDSIEKFTKSGLIVPARIDTANSAVFLNTQKPKNSKAFLTTIENSIPTPVNIHYREILDDIKLKNEPLFNK